MEQEQKLVLGYWPIRGLAQRLRYLLEFTELPYTEKRYQSKEEWFDQDKSKLNSDLPNLPYLIDGDFVVTETMAIQEYIIKKSGKLDLLGGNDLQAQARVTQLFSSYAIDFQGAVVKLVYNPEFKNMRPTYFNDVFKAKLEKLSKHLKDRKFLNGENVCVADFTLYEYVTEISLIYPEDFKTQFPNLEQYLKNFEAIPQIQKYLNSDRYIATPWSMEYAGWRGP